MKYWCFPPYKIDPYIVSGREYTSNRLNIDFPDPKDFLIGFFVTTLNEGQNTHSSNSISSNARQSVERISSSARKQESLNSRSRSRELVTQESGRKPVKSKNDNSNFHKTQKLYLNNALNSASKNSRDNDEIRRLLSSELGHIDKKQLNNYLQEFLSSNSQQHSQHEYMNSTTNKTPKGRHSN